MVVAMGREKEEWAKLERRLKEAIWRGETLEEQAKDCVEVVRGWLVRERREECKIKHIQLWHWLLGKVEKWVNGEPYNRVELSMLKRRGIIELWGEEEAERMGRFHYCYACEEAYYRGVKRKASPCASVCAFCPLDSWMCKDWLDEDGKGFVKGTYCAFSSAFDKEDWGECVEKAKELLSIKWKDEH